MVLVGPSGCGKTTLLRSIGGLEKTTSGRILIGDRDVTRVEPGKRDLAMVFQNYALYPHMTVRQNLGYGLRVRRTPRKERDQRVHEVATLLGLEDLLNRRPGQLSGGQQQRVAMGRAIVREPAAYLMDEPLSNLDAKLRVTMRTSLQELHHRLRTTTVYVTHDQVEAMTLGQRVAVMRDGKIQQVDQPQRLYDDPTNLFVAAFIGSPAMNLGETSIGGDSVALGGFAIPLDREHSPRFAHEGRAIVGIRPEAFEDAEFSSSGLPQHRGACGGARGARLRRIRLLRGRRDADRRRGDALGRRRRGRTSSSQSASARCSQPGSTRGRRRRSATRSGSPSTRRASTSSRRRPAKACSAKPRSAGSA